MRVKSATTTSNPKILQRLGKDRLHEVRQAVARNPRTPFATLNELSNDLDFERIVAHENTAVTALLAEIRACSDPASLAGHANHPLWLARAEVAANSNCHRATYEQLATDSQAVVRAHTFTKVSAETKEHLATDPDERVRQLATRLAPLKDLLEGMRHADTARQLLHGRFSVIVDKTDSARPSSPLVGPGSFGKPSKKEDEKD
ncbi:hypothetical protein ACFL31_04370 [Candidatus Margulisiibacteriota bacterium]